MGEILVRATQISVLIVVASGVPLLLYGFHALRFWMGQDFAASSVSILQVLVLANMIRFIGLPYSAMLLGTGKQWFATVAAVGEAGSNFIASIFLAKHIGAIGVAYGTLVGALVSIALIFTVCRGATRKTLDVKISVLARHGVLRPGISIIPVLLVFPLWWTNHAPPFHYGMLGLVDFATVILLVFGLGLNKGSIVQAYNFVRNPHS
jgi:O-antigen/teichoic acid export membrane protein